MIKFLMKRNLIHLNTEIILDQTFEVLASFVRLRFYYKSRRLEKIKLILYTPQTFENFYRVRSYKFHTKLSSKYL